MHQHSIIFQSCVNPVKILIMCFIPLPLGLVVKYLSNRSVRKVKHNYKDPKLFFLSRIMHLEVYNFGGQKLFCYHCQPAAVFVMQQLDVTEAVASLSVVLEEGEVGISNCIVKKSPLFLRWVRPTQLPFCSLLPLDRE